MASKAASPSFGLGAGKRPMRSKTIPIILKDKPIETPLPEPPKPELVKSSGTKRILPVHMQTKPQPVVEPPPSNELPSTQPNTPTESHSESSSSHEGPEPPKKKRKRNTPKPPQFGRNDRIIHFKNWTQQKFNDFMSDALLWIAEHEDDSYSSNEEEEEGQNVDLEEIPTEQIRILLSEEQKQENKTR